MENLDLARLVPLRSGVVGARLRYVPRVTSTMDEARRLAEDGAHDGLVVVAEEQTLGRGLRLMYSGTAKESVSVIGTDAFMEFVESIQSEGVELERQSMGRGSKPKASLVIEVDKENGDKDLDALDIEIPMLTGRNYHEYKDLADLDVTLFSFTPVIYQEFDEVELREIVFRDMTTGEVTHTTVMNSNGTANYRSTLQLFSQTIMKELSLFSGYDVVYGKVKNFVENELFGETVVLDSPNTLRNLAEITTSSLSMLSFRI